MWEFPGGQVGKIAAFIAMDQVQSLVGELRSCKPEGAQKKKKRKISVYIRNNHQRRNKQRQNKTSIFLLSVQFSSVTQLCPTLCNPMDCIRPGFPVHHQHRELAQIHIHWVSDAIQPSHPPSSPSPTFNICQHQGLFQWVSTMHQVAKVLEFQLQHHSFQLIFRTDFF